MGYITYMFGELCFDRVPTEQEIAHIDAVLRGGEIWGLELDGYTDASDAIWIITPIEKTKCGEEMIENVRKLCQEAESLGLQLTGEIRLSGMENTRTFRAFEFGRIKSRSSPLIFAGLMTNGSET